MQITASVQPLAKAKADVILLYCTPKSGADKSFPPPVRPLLDHFAHSNQFAAKPGEAMWLHQPSGFEAEWLLLFGLGDPSKMDTTALLARLGQGLKQAYGRKRAKIAVGFSGWKASGADAGTLVGLAAYRAAYSFRQYLAKGPNDDTDEAPSPEVTIYGAAGSSPLKEINALGAAIDYARQIANQPPNVLHPDTLADEAAKLGKKHKLQVTVWDEHRLEKEGFGGILAVGSGSIHAPRFIRIDYQGGKKGAAPICVVGKAITFDSGGISIKPSDRMDEMKFDKCGGVAVLGILDAVASLRLKHNVIGLIASAENLPSATSYRPGDLVKNLGGKYIEVLNTDAEGRIVLSDALVYACKLKPRAIVDLATLTGACIVALGSEAAGLLGNDAKLLQALQKAGDRVGERLWPMPLFAEFEEKVKSDVGYVKNTAGREGGTCTAAAFLKAFVDDGVPWAHLDIAGTAWTTKDEGHRPKGATAFGVAAIVEWLRGLS
ncbi:MAG: leucyl aminopeptidase [Verrucomicrobiae bacterium]|nr:leucyl aminopeptidase [Verrucomicrobiae bacterium]